MEITLSPPRYCAPDREWASFRAHRGRGVVSVVGEIVAQLSR